MQDYYRINVSKDGYYIFATEQGRITTRAEAESVIKLFRTKFTEAEGYNVTCTHWRYSCEHITV